LSVYLDCQFIWIVSLSGLSVYLDCQFIWIVSLSGLSIIMDCPFGFLSRLFNVQKQPVNLNLMFCYYSYILGPLIFI
jgi:hypothetical protein